MVSSKSQPHNCRRRPRRGVFFPAFAVILIGYYSSDGLDLVSAWSSNSRQSPNTISARPISCDRRIPIATALSLSASAANNEKLPSSKQQDSKKPKRNYKGNTAKNRKRQERSSNSGKRTYSAPNSSRPKAQTVSELVQTVRASLNTKPGKGDWRTAWSLLQSEATIPHASVDCNSINDDDHITVLPIRVYHEILQSMAHDKKAWQEAVRLVQYLERGSDEVDDNATNVNQENTGKVVDKYNSRPWYIPSPNYEIYHTVIDCCCNNGGGRKDAHDASVYWLTRMLRKFERDVKEPSPSEGNKGLTNRDRKLVRNSIQLILTSFSKQRKWREALQLLDYSEVLATHFPLTIVQYNTVLTCLARSKQAGHCQRLLQRLQTKTIRPDEISYNAVISACASVGRWKDALQVLDECYKEPDVTPNIYIYTNAMRACAKGGNTQKALSLLEDVKDKGLPVDSYCYTAVIDACAKGKQWKKAMELFDEMEEKGIAPTQVTYSVTISALGNGLQWERALQLLNVMREKGMQVNLITYNAAITALAKSSKNRHSAQLSPSATMQQDSDDAHELQELWPKALALLKQMDEDGIEPDGFCYSSAINCCGAEGRWEEACQLIETMKKGGPKSRPNKIAYTAAISACGRAGQASKALELFQDMRDDGLSADRVAYNALFSALRVSKDADKAYELWGEICGTRTKKTSSIATARNVASPDIITLTDCIATLSRAGYTRKMDEVFSEGVDLGIVLANNDLDQQWEIDLSGLPLPIARAATRYLMRSISDKNGNEDIHDMIFITGIGKAQQKRREEASSPASETPNNVLDKKDRTTSLRDFIQGILETDFEPPIVNTVPPRAQGTVVIEKESLSRWLNEENGTVVTAH